MEILLRRALWSMGARYRLHVVDLPGKPDIVFPIRRIAIFCDGDFWHDRAWAGQRQKIALGSNSAYWISKIEYNIVRDRAITKTLRSLGWTVMRFWEKDIRKDPVRVALRVTRTLRREP